MFLDGKSIYSGSSENVEITDPAYWDITAGGDPWGKNLSGDVADISIVRDAVSIDGNETLYERMYSIDQTDVLKNLDVLQESVVKVDVNGEPGTADLGNVDEYHPDVIVYADGSREITVNSVEELATVLQGDVSDLTIKLAPGDYIGVGIHVASAEGLTITSADIDNPARISGMVVKGASNVSFENIDFTLNNTEEAAINWGRYIIRVEDSSGVDFVDSVIAGGDEGIRDGGLFGLYARNSEDISLENNEITLLTRGALFDHVTGVSATGNSIYNIRSDGLDFVGIDNAIIENNRFKDFYPAEGDHADYVQFWTESARRGNSNIVIRDNFMVQGDGGSSQAIFIHDEDGLGNSNILIENNVIYQSGYHGITVTGATGLTIQENTVLSNVGVDRPTWIMVNNSENVDVLSNIASSYELEGGIVNNNGNVIAAPNSEFGVAYEELFGMPLTVTSGDLESFVVANHVDAGANALSMILEGSPYAGDGGDNLIKSGNTGSALYGFSGDDSLIGGSGDDILFGGWGADQLTGGDGSDIFKFYQARDAAIGADSYDKILDFTGEDRISLESLASSDLQFIGADEFFGLVHTEQDEIPKLTEAASEFGVGPVNLGRNDGFFNLDDMTLSVTFELNDLNSGKQGLLWNHMQYGILVNDDALQVVLRGTDGALNYIHIGNALTEAGWHDTQVVMDSNSQTLEIFLDGVSVYQGGSENYDITGVGSWDVFAGSQGWGYDLNGQVADVSILDQAIDISSEEMTYERTVSVDQYDELLDMDVATGITQVRFDDASDMLFVDVEGDQVADMQIELVGVDLNDLDQSSFLF